MGAHIGGRVDYGPSWEGWLTADDVAARLRISRSTALNLVNRGAIRAAIAVKGRFRAVMVHPDDLAEFVERSRIGN